MPMLEIHGGIEIAGVDPCFPTPSRAWMGHPRVVQVFGLNDSAHRIFSPRSEFAQEGISSSD